MSRKSEMLNELRDEFKQQLAMLDMRRNQLTMKEYEQHLNKLKEAEADKITKLDY